VRNSFIRSFELVQKIAKHTETEVMEEYLKMRWKEFEPSLGDLPTGEDAIAKMRLVCMAQMNAGPISAAFPSLPKDDADVLCTETSRTGCLGQSYSLEQRWRCGARGVGGGIGKCTSAPRRKVNLRAFTAANPPSEGFGDEWDFDTMNVLLDRWAYSHVQFLRKRFLETTGDKGEKELDNKGFFALFAELQDMPKAEKKVPAVPIRLRPQCRP
jgi:hypothetical protein